MTAEIISLTKDHLKRALASEIKGAERDFSHGLLVALGPDATVSEINGARTVLSLVLGALPAPLATGTPGGTA